MAPSFRVESPGLPPLEFTEAAGWIVDVVDLGEAEPREEQREATDIDGIVDTTSLIGARDVIVTGTVLATAERALWQQKGLLTAFLSQRRRTDVFVREHPAAPEMVLRGCRAVRIPRRVVDRTDDRFTAVWRAPRGVLESSTVVHTEIFPGYATPPGGWEFDWEFDLEFPAGEPPGGGVVVNGFPPDVSTGYDAWPVLRIDGPCSTDGTAGEIVIESLTVGRRLVFVDLEILEGDYLEIDTRARTIRLNSLADQSRHDHLDMSQTSWWPLVPGLNELRFLPAEWTPPARLLVSHRHTYL